MSKSPVGLAAAIGCALGLMMAATDAATPSATAGAAEEASANPAPPVVPADVGSYDIGLLLGSQLANDGLASTISREQLLRGLDAGLAGAAVTTSQREAAQNFVRAARTDLVGRNSEEARKFLESNGRKSGVTTLRSGLQYRVLADAAPTAPMPGPRDQITVRYRTSLADGTEVDRSDTHAQPAVFRLNSVIPGWREALSSMRVGSRWQVFVPPELGYGANSPPPIPPGSVLVYELELLKIEPAKPLAPDAAKPPVRAAAPDAPAKGSAPQ